MIHLIVAIDQNRAIGKNNDLLCYLPADLKNFKEITSGNTIVMGRKTFESLPKGALPNRTNIVISHQKRDYPDTLSAQSLEEAIALAPKDQEIYIIGGASIYEQALPLCEMMHITFIENSFEGADTFFPTWKDADWEVIEKSFHAKDEKNRYDFTIVTLKRLG